MSALYSPGKVFAWYMILSETMARIDLHRGCARRGEDSDVPRSVDSLLAEARQARHDSRYSEAIRAFEDVLGQCPNNLAAQIEYAGSLIQAGRIHDAGPIVAALVRTMPQHPGVRAEAGALMRARGLFAEALAHYEIAAEHAPDPTLTLIAVADVAARSDDTRAR